MYRYLSVLLLLSCASAWAERPGTSASLATWLTQSAAPELARTLGHHPRFKGERIRIAAITQGQTAGAGNALTESIRQQLTHQILRTGKNDVVVTHDQQNCQRVSKAVHYLVSIDVQPSSHTRHRVNLAILDTTDGAWVSGVSLVWEGRLSISERDALASPVVIAPPGTFANPVALQDHRHLARLLYTQMNCNLQQPRGAIAPENQDSAELQVILHEVMQQLTLAAWATTSDGESARWRLHTKLSDLGAQRQQLSLQLTAADDSEMVQQLAAVVVSNRHPINTGAKQLVSPADPQPASLLSALQITSPGTSCRGKANCAVVTFDLHEDAYLLTFSTQQHTVTPATCSTRGLRKTNGEQRYRITAPSHADDRVGVYVIASSDRAAIRNLHQQLRRAPGACGNSARRDQRQWLADTLAQLHSTAVSITWRALHLARTSSGLRRL